MAGKRRVSDHLSPDGVIIGSDFRIIGKRIGAGNFGEVRIGENKTTGQKVAVKIEREADMRGARKVPETRERERER